MISRTNIIKCAVLIIFAAVLFLILSMHVQSNAAKVANSVDKAQVEIKTPVSNSAKVEKSVQNASVKANAELSKAEVQAIANRSDLNNYVLRIIPAYKDGKYPYLLNSDYEHYNGVTENIYYRGSIIAKANPDGSRSSHCVGLTYEVFFKAMQLRNREAGLSPDNFNNMTINNMRDFLLTWYAAKGSPKSEGDQLAGAIVRYGLGIRITQLENVRAGDFIDFSRTKSGHTAVFISWLKDGSGNITGFKYWSTQGSTNGIGYREEYFSDNPQGDVKGAVNRKSLYIGRVGAITSYKSF